jgi:hypothetical protein
MLWSNAVVRSRGTAPMACIKHARSLRGLVQVYECHPQILGRFVEHSYDPMPLRSKSRSLLTCRTGTPALRSTLTHCNIQTPIRTRYDGVPLGETESSAHFIQNSILQEDYHRMAFGRAFAVMADNLFIRHLVELWKALVNKGLVDSLEGVGAAEGLLLGRLGAGMSRRLRDDQSTRASLSGRTRCHHSQVRACSCRQTPRRCYCRLRLQVKLRTSQSKEGFGDAQL